MPLVVPPGTEAKGSGPSLDEDYAAAAELVGALAGRGLSNNWAVNGKKSATGKPLLANDPHLPLQMPSIFWECHLDSPELKVTGAALPATPGIVIGHNDRVAWGITAGGGGGGGPLRGGGEPANPPPPPCGGGAHAVVPQRGAGARAPVPGRADADGVPKLGRVPRGAAALVRALPELRLRRYRRQHRLPARRGCTGPRQGPRRPPRPRLERRVRVDRLGGARGAPPGPLTAPRLGGDGQKPAR